jgi:hypothetical protein
MERGNLAEMKAVDCERDCQREEARTPEQGPGKEPPVLNAFAAAYTQLVYGLPQSHNILQLELNSDFGRLVLTKECQNALLIKLGRIDLFQDFAIAFPQRLQ